MTVLLLWRLALLWGALVGVGAARAAPLPCEGLLSPTLVSTLASIATANVDTEYPNLVHHTMQSDADVMPPRRLTPAFYGSYDWHSAVHSHWQLGACALAFVCVCPCSLTWAGALSRQCG
jgi:hypothetical protein